MEAPDLEPMVELTWRKVAERWGVYFSEHFAGWSGEQIYQHVKNLSKAGELDFHDCNLGEMKIIGGDVYQQKCVCIFGHQVATFEKSGRLGKRLPRFHPRDTLSEEQIASRWEMYLPKMVNELNSEQIKNYVADLMNRGVLDGDVETWYWPNGGVKPKEVRVVTIKELEEFESQELSTPSHSDIEAAIGSVAKEQGLTDGETHITKTIHRLILDRFSDFDFSEFTADDFKGGGYSKDQLLKDVNRLRQKTGEKGFNLDNFDRKYFRKAQQVLRVVYGGKQKIR